MELSNNISSRIVLSKETLEMQFARVTRSNVIKLRKARFRSEYQEKLANAE